MKNKKPEVNAKAKHIRISPPKLQRVANVVRGQSTKKAMAILHAIPQRGATIIKEVLKSAIANAKHNKKLNENELYISQILVNAGTPFRRFQPKARGRMNQILKRTSHIFVGLDRKEGGK